MPRRSGLVQQARSEQASRRWHPALNRSLSDQVHFKPQGTRTHNQQPSGLAGGRGGWLRGSPPVPRHVNRARQSQGRGPWGTLGRPNARRRATRRTSRAIGGPRLGAAASTRTAEGASS
jgi:hypothetical protein